MGLPHVCIYIKVDVVIDHMFTSFKERHTYGNNNSDA